MDITIILAACIFLLSVWNIVLTILMAKEKQVFKDLAKGVTKKDLLSILKQITNSQSTASEKIKDLKLQLETIQKLNRNHIQKLGFVRFNPFSDTGGDQSFCLCLLDQNNNGIVITSLHSRDTTRLYAKHVSESSLKDIILSQEEIRCYQEAVKNQINTNSHVKEIVHDAH